MLIMWMGPEQFAVDMAERPTDFFGLYDALCERHREQYELVAASPAEFVIYGDNVTSEMCGPDRFTRYIASCYNECAELLHARGKRLGSHLDGKTIALRDAIGACKLDFLEAFSPFPDADMPLAEAYRAWPDKVLSINYPSPVHLQDDAAIAEHTRQMLRDVAPGTRFSVGITENIPEGCWRRSLPIIGRVLAEEGHLPLAL
jgi:hypothetical protein